MIYPPTGRFESVFRTHTEDLKRRYTNPTSGAPWFGSLVRVRVLVCVPVVVVRVPCVVGAFEGVRGVG